MEESGNYTRTLDYLDKVEEDILDKLTLNTTRGDHFCCFFFFFFFENYFLMKQLICGYFCAIFFVLFVHMLICFYNNSEIEFGTWKLQSF